MEGFEECAASAKDEGCRARRRQARNEREPAGPGLFPLPGYERKTKLVEIADDHVDDMRRAVTNIAWYYSSSGDYKNNAAFKAGNTWGWARKDSQAAEGIVTSLDEEGPDSKIIFDGEEFWFDESADKLWRKKLDRVMEELHVFSDESISDIRILSVTTSSKGRLGQRY